MLRTLRDEKRSQIPLPVEALAPAIVQESSRDSSDKLSLPERPKLREEMGRHDSEGLTDKMNSANTHMSQFFDESQETP